MVAELVERFAILPDFGVVIELAAIDALAIASARAVDSHENEARAAGELAQLRRAVGAEIDRIARYPLSEEDRRQFAMRSGRPGEDRPKPGAFARADHSIFGFEAWNLLQRLAVAARQIADQPRLGMAASGGHDQRRGENELTHIALPRRC